MWRRPPSQWQQLERQRQIDYFKEHDVFFMTALFEECMKMGIAPMYNLPDNFNIVLKALPPDVARKMKRKFRKIWRKERKQIILEARREKRKQRKNYKRYPALKLQGHHLIRVTSRRVRDQITHRLNGKPTHDAKMTRKIYVWMSLMTRAQKRADELRFLASTKGGGDIHD